MTRLSAAEEFLINRIRSGDADAWRQLVERYQGRLMAFAAHDLPSAADAEDTVQETFVSLLQSLNTYRAESSLETYLFVILRRRIADFFRRQGRDTPRPALPDEPQADPYGAARQVESSEKTASWYLRRDESRARQFGLLAHAVEGLVSSMRDDLNFDDLLLVELLFGVQQRNKDVANLLQVDEKWIALRKHRFTKRLSQQVRDDCPEPDAPTADLDSILTQMWNELRPTCPKRSTLGKYLLGTLDDSWNDYIARHLSLVGCRFCAANRQDLENESEQPERHAATSEIMRSTIGFFRPDSSAGGSRNCGYSGS